MNNTTELSTKATLLQTSRRLFSHAGFDQVSVRKICDEAGCNVSSVSYYFGGKEALYRACLEENGQGIQSIIRDTLKNPTDRADFEVKLRLFLERFYAHLCDNADTIGILVHEIRSTAPLAADIIDRYYLDIPKRLERFLTEAQDRGIIHDHIDTQLVSDLMLSKAFNSIFWEAQSRQMRGTCVRDIEERNKVIQQTLKIFTGGIYA